MSSKNNPSLYLVRHLAADGDELFCDRVDEDPLRRPVCVVLMPAERYQRGGAKLRFLTERCSERCAREKGDLTHMNYHGPEGTVCLLVEGIDGTPTEGYRAEYALEPLTGRRVTLRWPAEDDHWMQPFEAEAFSSPFAHEVGWRFLRFCEVLPGDDGQSTGNKPLQGMMRKMSKQVYPDGGCHVFGANLLPHRAKLIGARQPSVAELKRRADRGGAQTRQMPRMTAAAGRGRR